LEKRFSIHYNLRTTLKESVGSTTQKRNAEILISNSGAALQHTFVWGDEKRDENVPWLYLIYFHFRRTGESMLRLGGARLIDRRIASGGGAQPGVWFSSFLSNRIWEAGKTRALRFFAETPAVNSPAGPFESAGR
jgi:hypothetical protein